MRADREQTVLDEHLGRALAALDEVGVRELEAAATALEKRDDGLSRFGGVFSAVAFARERGTDNPRGAWYMLGGAIEELDDESAGRLEGASAPFWRLVLEARAELHEEHG